MNRLNVYWQVWKLNAINKLQVTFINRWTSSLFMIGKSFRFGMMLFVLFAVFKRVGSFGGYTTDQIVVFFLIYQFIDVSAQVLFRGVYSFQQKIRTGEFDSLLRQPINPLFQSLLSDPDINDTVFLIPTTALSIYLISHLSVTITLSSFLWFLLLLCNTFLIVIALHIVILVFGILTNEVDGVVWLYRDLSQFGRFPLTIYKEPIRTALFFLVPIGMMFTIPSQVLLTLTPTYSVVLASVVGIGFFMLSLWLWDWALKQYTSASS